MRLLTMMMQSLIHTQEVSNQAFAAGLTPRRSPIKILNFLDSTGKESAFFRVEVLTRGGGRGILMIPVRSHSPEAVPSLRALIGDDGSLGYFCSPGREWTVLDLVKRYETEPKSRRVTKLIFENGKICLK